MAGTLRYRPTIEALEHRALLSADLTLSLVASPDSPQAGAVLTYTLTVRNTGPDLARGVSLLDVLPSRTSLAAAASSQGTCRQLSAAVLCDLSDLAAGGGATVVLRAIPTNSAAGTVLRNQAVVTASTSDPDGSNNNATSTSSVPYPPSLEGFALVTGPGSPAVGQPTITPVFMTCTQSQGQVLCPSSGQAGFGVYLPEGALSAHAGATITATVTFIVRYNILTQPPTPIYGSNSGPCTFTDHEVHCPVSSGGLPTVGASLSLPRESVPASVPVLTPPTRQTATEGVGQEIALGAFSAAGTSGPWSVAVAWSDGTDPVRFAATSAGSLGTQTHTFATAGSYPVTVLMTSANGEASATVFHVDVLAQPFLVTAADAGGPPLVRLYSPTGSLLREFEAYGSTFTGGVRVAVGDVTGDRYPDLVTAPGPGGLPFVNLFDGHTLQRIRQFQVYDLGFTNGVNVAVGNVLGTADSPPEIVVTPDVGGQPYVNVLDSRTGELLRSFLAYAHTFTGGVRVAIGDTEGDGSEDVVVAPQAGGAPVVNVFNADTQTLVRQRQVFGEGFTGGVYLALGNVDEISGVDILVGAGGEGVPVVNAFDGATGAFVRRYQAYGDSFRAGVRVGAADYNADGMADIVVGPGPGADPFVRLLDGVTEALLGSFAAFAPHVTAGLFVVGVPR